VKKASRNITTRLLDKGSTCTGAEGLISHPALGEEGNKKLLKGDGGEERWISGRGKGWSKENKRKPSRESQAVILGKAWEQKKRRERGSEKTREEVKGEDKETKVDTLKNESVSARKVRGGAGG